MDITQANLAFFFRQANVQYGQTFTATPTWYEQVASVIPSSTRSNTYGWMARIPAMRQWVGPRTIHAVATHSRVVTNLPFELTDSLKSEDVRHDQFGLFNMNLQFMAQQAKKLADHQIANFLATNTTTTYDGKVVFATDHPVLGGDVVGNSSASQKNLYTSTDLTFDNYAAVRAGMMGLLGEDGKPLNVTPSVLMVPPQLESKGKLVLEADFLGNTGGTAPQSNIWKGTAKLLVVPELAAKPYNWYLLDTTKPIKPLMWQQEMAPRFSYLVSPTDLPVFMQRDFVYGVEAWGAAAETLWPLIACATSAGSY